MLFKILPEKRLEEIREKNSSDFSEKELEDLLAPNLEKIFPNLIFVSRQFRIEEKKLDILAFDEELNAPVVIELKKDNSKSLFDQGMEYFHILLNQKSDFVLEIHEKLNLPADAKKINWENSRVVFIGKNFSMRQKRAVDFSGISIELWDYDFFENDFLKLEKVGLKKTAKLEISGIGGKSKKIEKITREFKEYDRNFHHQKTTPKIWELFEKIESEFSNWDEIKMRFTKNYVAFLKNEKTFLRIKFYQSKIHCLLLEKPKTKSFKIKDISKFHHKPLKWEIHVLNDKNLDELIFILKQNYKFISEK